jgi:uncharacterized membrane protein YdjX (TVP38/TMEM64 family)
MNHSAVKWKIGRFVWLFAVGIGVCLLWRYFPIASLFDQDVLIRKFEMAGAWGVVVFILAHIVATAIGLPGTVLVIVGGAVYGLFWGTLWSVIGATLGAIAAFILSRYFLHDWFERRLGHHPTLKGLKHIMQRHALNCVLMIRFMPISPFNLINFLFGLTPISLRPYAVGTFFGIIPGTAIYTWIGVSGVKTLHGEGMSHLVLPLTALVILSVLPIAFKKFKDTKSTR